MIVEVTTPPTMGVAIRFMTVRRIMPFDWLWQVQDLSGSTRGQGFSYFKKSAMKAAINFVDNEKV